MSISRRRLLVLLSVALLFSSVAARDAFATVSTVPTVSGSLDYLFTNYAGTSEYTIQYSYPGQVTIGQNLTITLTVFVDQLTELKLYVYSWGAVSTINSPGGRPVSGQVLSRAGEPFLYQGGHWGPVFLEIPIAAGNFSGTGTQPYSTSLVIEWVADVWYDKPYNYHYEESDIKLAGNVTVVSPGQQTAGSSIYYYIAGAGAVAVLGGVVAWVVSRNRKRAPADMEATAPVKSS